MYDLDRNSFRRQRDRARITWEIKNAHGFYANMAPIATIVRLFPELPPTDRIAAVVQAAAEHTTLSFSEVADRFASSSFVSGTYATGRRHGYGGERLLHGMERALRYDLGILHVPSCDATMITK